MAYRAKLLLSKDVNGNVTYGIMGNLGPDQNSSTTLATSVAQSITVPDWAYQALFTFNTGSNVFVNRSAAATIPGGAFANDTNELNPVLRGVIPGGSVSFITGDTNAYVTVTFFDEPTR